VLQMIAILYPALALYPKLAPPYQYGETALYATIYIFFFSLKSRFKHAESVFKTLLVHSS